MNADRKLFTLVSILIFTSVILSYTLASYATLLFDVNEFHFALHQSLFALLGIGIIFLLSRLDPDIWLKRIGFLLFLGSLLIMIVMPFMPESLVSAVGGAKRWIKIAGFSFAPVEFFKVGFVYFLAWSFSRKLGDHDGIGLGNELKRFIPYAVIFIGAMFIIAFLQKDLGQVVVLGLTLLFMLIFAGSSFRFFLSISGAIFVAILIFILTAEHRVLRIKSWWALAQNSVLELLPPSLADKLHVPVEVEPYQIGNSLNAIHNGGIFGVGIGDGTFKLGFLSAVHTDFVLAGLSEEFGFVGVVFVVVIFLWMLQRIFKVANRSQEKSVYLFSIGLGMLLSFTFLVNAYGISGITPIKGISVPFISYGGSTMLGSAFGIGMVLMASSKIDMERRIEP